MHMGGVRQAARCPYGAAEPSWAMVRCYSSSHPPILYTACVGSYNFSHIIYSPGDALNAILNYWVEELRMNYVALAIALG